MTALALCLLPAYAFPNTALDRAKAKTSEIMHLLIEPEPIVQSPQKPEPEEDISDSWDVIMSGPSLINVSSSDRKAQLAVKDSLRLFTKTIRPRFEMWLERSGRYIEVMHDVLKERDMPTELVFLPIVESGFNPRAYSTARAVGPWQFIAETGKRYGLVIDWWRDERRDPVKSTVAASKYLSDLYGMFGSWSLALAAYNTGEGRIAKAVKRTNSSDFWKLHSSGQIARETKDYVPRFIAAAMIAKEPGKYGFDVDYQERFEYDEVIVYQPVDLDVAARCAGTTVENIKELNPELRRWSTPPHLKQYTLRIPAGKADFFIDKLSETPDNKIFTYDRYVVKKKDNIHGIAARSKVPVSVILELNSLARAEKVRPGAALRLPPRGKYSADMDDRMTAMDAVKAKVINSNIALIGDVANMKASDSNKKNGKKTLGDRNSKKSPRRADGR